MLQTALGTTIEAERKREITSLANDKTRVKTELGIRKEMLMQTKKLSLK